MADALTKKVFISVDSEDSQQVSLKRVIGILNFTTTTNDSLFVPKSPGLHKDESQEVWRYPEGCHGQGEPRWTTAGTDEQ